MATMNDVARRAGVSIATVSGVLNGSRQVSPELAGRVLEAVRELDYTINQAARSLHSRSTQLVAMLVPDISDPFHANVVRVVEDALKTAGYTLLLGNLRDRPEEQRRYLQTVRAQQADGVLIYMVPGCEDDLRRLVEAHKPVVLMGRPPTTFRCDFVAIDHVNGTRMAIEHLIARGHRRIGIIPGPEHQSFSLGRVEGWAQALKHAGLPTCPGYVSYGGYTVEGGEAGIARLLDLPEPPTAVLAGNFHEIVGVLRTLRRRRIPRNENFEIMASHDSDALDAFDPPVSSVDQPVHEIGAKATELLLRRIRQPRRPPEAVLLRPRLKIRTAPVPFREAAS